MVLDFKNNCDRIVKKCLKHITNKGQKMDIQNLEKDKKKSTLESEVFRIMEMSLKSAMQTVLDDLFKDWK